MAGSERYPGERRGLRLFLEGIIGAINDQIGPDSLLYRRVRRALDRGDLASLRDARQMFNHQDIHLKRCLSLASGTAQSASADGVKLARTSILVEDEAGDGERLHLRLVSNTPPTFDQDRLAVHVPDSSLPSDVARRLRRIADAVERDRRLLSVRHLADRDEDPVA